MRIELVFIIITGLIVGNIYTDGKYYKMLTGYQKYYKMASVVFGAYVLYWVIKKNPSQATEIVKASNEYLKYMPVDRNTTKMVSPFLDFGSRNVLQEQQSTERLMQSGKKGTKRSVSETKKKFVASNQNWKCGDCQKQLNAWFEVDHKTRLEHGGSNHVENLVALCRDCHGKKTTMENL